MTYLELAKKLETLASKLTKYAPRINGPDAAKAAALLDRAITSFESRLDESLGGSGATTRGLVDLLGSPQARKHLKVDGWKQLSSTFLGRALHEETSAAMKKAFLKEVVARGKAEAAVVALKDFLAVAAAETSPPPEDAADLRRDFLRLGGLPEDEMIRELRTRYKRKTAIRKLAVANGLRVPKDFDAAKLVREIVHYARRAHENIRA